MFFSSDLQLEIKTWYRGDLAQRTRPKCWRSPRTTPPLRCRANPCVGWAVAMFIHVSANSTAISVPFVRFRSVGRPAFGNRLGGGMAPTPVTLQSGDYLGFYLEAGQILSLSPLSLSSSHSLSTVSTFCKQRPPLLSNEKINRCSLFVYNHSE